jgi:hypothetical protein
MPENFPNPPKQWKWWQVALGWFRKILNAGHAGGVLPKKKHGPEF